MSNSEPPIRYVSGNNPIQRVKREYRDQIVAAQSNAIDREFATAEDLCTKVFDELGLSIPIPASYRDVSVREFTDQPYHKLVERYTGLLHSAGVSGQIALEQAMSLAERTHLIRAFEHPDRTLEKIAAKVLTVVETFPRAAANIERGRNPGDVLDPYILAASQLLLYNGDFEKAIGGLVAHKALMAIEGLMGHLHEDVIGDMRGNVRAPEPRGKNQEIIDPHTNPFPGSDVLQPPLENGDSLRFHQIKSKTGSAKGGDGRRLGEQLRTLKQYYESEVYYDALIGNTLRGHRSMRGVLSIEPDAVVLVGQAAFQVLTGSTIGPELLLHIYRNTFAEVAAQSGYRVDDMATAIVSEFGSELEATEGTFLDLLLKNSIGINLEEQDSRIFLRDS